MNFQDLMKDCPCITILRGVEPQEINDIADAICDGGIKLLEITLNSPVGPLDSIAKAVEHTKGRTPDEIRKAAALLVNSFKTIC